MAVLNIEGHGAFTLNAEQIQSLLAWLKENSIAQTVATEGSKYEGNTLLNEEQKGPGNPSPKGPIKSGPEGDTWDMGTTWI